MKAINKHTESRRKAGKKRATSKNEASESARRKGTGSPKVKRAAKRGNAIPTSVSEPAMENTDVPAPTPAGDEASTSVQVETETLSQPLSKRPGNKTAAILDLLQREGGATLAEIMAATGWQAHSVRGFLSGTLGKKRGITIRSEKRVDGARVYSLSTS